MDTAGGGDCRPLTRREDSTGSQQRPDILPDGKHFLFSTSARETVGTYVGDIDTGDFEPLLPGAMNTQFLPPDWVLYTESPVGIGRGLLSLMAQRIDLRRLEPVGEPVVVFRGITTPGGVASYAAAANGVLVAVRLPSAHEPLVWVMRDGRVADSVAVPQDPWTYSVTRDGLRIAMGGRGLFIHHAGRGVTERIFTEAGERRITWHPAWSPGDSMLAFSALIDGPPALHVYHVRNGSVSTLIDGGDRTIGRVAWSPDGAEIAFWLRPGPEAPTDQVWVHNLASGTRRMLFAARGGETEQGSLAFSPDGGWLVYSAAETGNMEVHLRSYPVLGAPRRVSSGGGTHAHWSADGRTIYYQSLSGQVMAVPVADDDARSLGSPRVVAPAGRHDGLWGVSADGNRFLRAAYPFRAGEPELRLITRWQERALRSVGGPQE